MQLTKGVQGETQTQWMWIEEGGRQDMLCMWKVGPYDQKLLGETQREGNGDTIGVGKRKWRTVSS